MMTKLDYLSSLERYLKRQLPEEEIYEIMRDYAEYFEDGKNQGKTEDEISAGLGSPYEVAQQILTEEKGEEPQRRPRRAKIDYEKMTRKVKDLNIGGFFLLILLIFLAVIIVPPLFGLLGSAALIFACVVISCLCCNFRCGWSGFGGFLFCVRYLLAGRMYFVCQYFLYCMRDFRNDLFLLAGT